MTGLVVIVDKTVVDFVSCTHRDMHLSSSIAQNNTCEIIGSVGEQA